MRVMSVDEVETLTRPGVSKQPRVGYPKSLRCAKKARCALQELLLWASGSADRVWSATAQMDFMSSVECGKIKRFTRRKRGFQFRGEGCTSPDLAKLVPWWK